MISELVFIYGLVDPRTNQVRYIGKTKKELIKRLSDHISESKYIRKKDHRANWIRSLLKFNLKPSIILLEEIPSEDWQWYEKWWIKYGRVMGWKLTNLTNGGEGTVGLIMSEESKKKISEAHKNLSEESHKRMSEGQKGNKNGIGNKNWAGKHHSEESKTKIGIANRGENNYRTPLKSEQVISMRELYDAGIMRIYELAKEFSVSYTTAKLIIYKRTWKHLL